MYAQMYDLFHILVRLLICYMKIDSCFYCSSFLIIHQQFRKENA